MPGNDHLGAAKLVEVLHKTDASSAISEAVRYAHGSTHSGETAIAALEDVLNRSDGTSAQRDNARRRLQQLQDERRYNSYSNDFDCD